MVDSWISRSPEGHHGFRRARAFIGNAVATFVVSKWEKALDGARLEAVLDRRAAAPVAVVQIDSR